MTDIRRHIDVDAERAFHNRRFELDDSRVAQSKYYWAIIPAMDRYWALVQEMATGADVLEYGCSTGEKTIRLCSRARSIHGIDISDVAIERAAKNCTDENVQFHVMDAANMGFRDNQFDLVFGSGIIHHLDTAQAMKEISRVLKPFGRAVFFEPLGLNPVINLYRYVTPEARTKDEHPLLAKDFAIMKRYFSRVDVEHYGLTTVTALPLKRLRMASYARDALAGIDRALFHVPGVKWLAWYSLFQLAK